MDLLLNAARNKFRFPSTKGALSFEQLWDLPLTSKSDFSLDGVAQELDHQVQAAGRTSFVEKNGNPAKTQLEEKLTLVVLVIETIQAENKLVRDAAARKAEKQQLLEILYNKKNEALLGLSAEEIQARIDALGV